jgi:hypothetical protein
MNERVRVDGAKSDGVIYGAERKEVKIVPTDSRMIY